MRVKEGIKDLNIDSSSLEDRKISGIFKGPICMGISLIVGG